MNRNSESHFANVPVIEQKRSTFDRSCGLKTTLGTGFLTPIYYDEVLPGDTITLDTSIVARMSTPIFPVMDNVNIDLYYFFVPNRLVWDHWKEFCGESNVSPYETQSTYQIPQISFPRTETPTISSQKWADFSVADYFCLPTQEIQSKKQDSTITVSALPFRAYCLIWNEFFRDQNLQDPVLIDTGDASIIGWSSNSVSGYSPVQSALHGFELLRAAKYHDYFTSCLPQPLAAPEVLLPAEGLLPVITDESVHLGDRIFTSGVKFQTQGGSAALHGFQPLVVQDGLLKSNSSGLSADSASVAVPYNLSAELTPEGLGVSINDFRLAYAVQKFLELQGRGGRRYTELVRSFFGVTSPDARLQRPEYLGGKQIHVNMDQVVQTSATNEKSPIGTTSAFSLTGDVDSSFTYSATEHGMIIGLAVPRAVHSYQQGIEKKWTRKNLTDFYWTPFANIGEQPVYTRELFINSLDNLDTVFGYQEAWAEYRYAQTHVTGAFRSAYSQSLDSWHYSDYYTAMPRLSASWIEEPFTNVARTLAVQTENSQYQQFLVDLWFDQRWTRCMPVYSVPGIWDRL